MNHSSCFGLPSVMNFHSPTCQGCVEKVACASACLVALESLQHKIDVTSEMAVIRHFIATHASTPVAPVVSAPALTTTIPMPTRSVAPERIRMGITDEQKTKLAALPVKVAQKMRALLQGGIADRALKEVRRGVNPFSRESHAYLADACDLLMTKGFTRTELREAFLAKNAWSKETAFSRVSATIGVFLALDLAEDRDGRLLLGPKAVAHTTN